jgi:hypothetical protein
MKIKSLLLVALAAYSLVACTKDEINNPTPADPSPQVSYGKFRLELDHMFNNASFLLNTDYTTGPGDNINISTFKYYLSNIQLQKADGSWWSAKESYYIVDVANTASTLLQVDSVPVAEYKAIRYMIGVDSVRNFSGAQTGALSPSNAMFWSWNSGYIFLKLEGSSIQAANPVKFHIGGFTGTNAAQSVIDHDFGNGRLRITPTANPQTHVYVQVNKFFDGASTISLATLNDVHMPGVNAKLVANNIATMFEFDHLHN